MSPSTKLRTSRKEITVRERATMILQVQAGKLTAREAAEALEISPQTYYEWEKRGLEAMMQGLTDRDPGRPSTAPDRETQKLQKEVGELRKQVMVMERTAELRAHLLALEKLKGPIKKKGRTRARRQRDETATSSELGTAQPLDRHSIRSSATLEQAGEHESAPGETARAPETGPGAADAGTGNR